MNFKNSYIESLFPNHNTKPNTGELILGFIIIFSVISLIIETEQTIYLKYRLFFQILDCVFLYLVSNIFLE